MNKDTRKYKTVSVTWATWDALKRRAAVEGRTVSGLVSVLVAGRSRVARDILRDLPVDPSPEEAHAALVALAESEP